MKTFQLSDEVYQRAVELAEIDNVSVDKLVMVLRQYTTWSTASVKPYFAAIRAH